MLNDVFDGVSMGLYAAFGSSVKIYQNDVKQGFSTPCFVLTALKPSLTPLVGNRYRSRVPLDVQYFPADAADNRTMQGTAETLFDCLGAITLPNGTTKLLGRDMSCEIQDGVLHFFVTYLNLLQKSVTAEQTMETLTMEEGVE